MLEWIGPRIEAWALRNTSFKRCGLTGAMIALRCFVSAARIASRPAADAESVGAAGSAPGCGRTSASR